MTSGDGPPLSLRPFPVADSKPKNIADFISRVNLQPGGFRDLSEEKLREQIRARDVDGDEPAEQDVDMSDGEDDDEPAAKDANAARMEVLKNIEYVAYHIPHLSQD